MPLHKRDSLEGEKPHNNGEETYKKTAKKAADLACHRPEKSTNVLAKKQEKMEGIEPTSFYQPSLIIFSANAPQEEQERKARS